MSSESAPKSIGNPSNPDQDRNSVLDIEYNKNNTSIMQIKENL